MTDTASTTTTRRIASATSIRYLGMCRSSWLTTCLACAAWCFGSCLAADAAVANWQPTVPVRGRAIEQVVFDAHNMPWATFQRESPSGKGAFIARLTKRYRLTQTQQVPSIQGMNTESPELVLNSSDKGDLIWGFNPPEVRTPPIGIAIAAWRPGRPIGQPLILTSQHYRGPSIAINRRGTTAALWASENSVEVARVRGGRLTGRQTIPIAGGRRPNSMEVLSSPTGGFLASWELRSGGTGPNQFNLDAVDTAHAPGGTGVFYEPLFTPWPAHEQGQGGVSEATLLSDARGDQVVLWEVLLEGKSGRETDLYVASRHAGKPFDASQFIGESELGSYDAKVTIGPTGLITILWQHMYSSKLLVTSGDAGHPLRSALPLWTRGPHISESEPSLVVTPDNQAIAIWTVRPETSKSAIMAATSNDGRHFTKPQQISVAGSNIHGCKAPKFLGVDRADGALAGWSCTYHRHGAINEYSHYVHRGRS